MNHSKKMINKTSNNDSGTQASLLLFLSLYFARGHTPSISFLNFRWNISHIIILQNLLRNCSTIVILCFISPFYNYSAAAVLHFCCWTVNIIVLRSDIVLHEKLVNYLFYKNNIIWYNCINNIYIGVYCRINIFINFLSKMNLNYIWIVKRILW